MEKLRLAYKTSVISYVKVGTGSQPAFCFHGYGEEAKSFAFLERYAGNEYTFFSIDLPYHGDTIWNEGFKLTVNDLQQIIKAILQKEPGQQTADNRQLTLIGFSLGGRVSLALYENMASQVKRLVLLAPDGVKVNFWYWLATQTWIGNQLFAFTMKHPNWFFGFLKLLNKLKLVNASIFKFVNYYIGDKEVRRLLYSRWTTLRKLKPGLNQIKSSIRDNKTKVRLIYGIHDRIILSSVGEKFRKGIEDYCSVTTIHSGHQVLHEKHAKEILPALLY